MPTDPNTRPAFATGLGRLCPRCARPAAACRCGQAEPEAVPEKIRCVLRLETKGRGGKTVTVVAGLPRNAAFLASLASELKRACGSGGTATEDGVELQGDRRERLRSLLAGKGYLVRG